MKPVCIPCQRFFRVSKVGYYFIEGMPKPGERPKAGTEDADKWQPYKLWVGDQWTCPGCGATIVSGVPSRPIAEHYQNDFSKTVEQLGAKQLQVNDC